MIAFASLFLGLIVGHQPVAVIVGNAVAAVDVELDGRRLGRLSTSPWTLDVDFGAELAPHELVARALDRKGREVGLARQWVNLPRPPAEVQIVLERDSRGRAVAARLAYETTLGVAPTRIAATFDGRTLPIQGTRVAIPAYDPSSAHVFTAILDYPDEVQSRHDIVIGGASSGDTGSELTAVPILTSDRKPPRREELKGRFSYSDRPLAVAAVERGPAQVFVVRDLSADEAKAAARRGFVFQLFGDPTSLENEDRLQMIWPVARHIDTGGTSNELFDPSRGFSGREASLQFLLTRVEHPVIPDPEPPRRFADAVAVAGLQACGTYARRAVVLVLGTAPDRSSYAPAAVRRYLERLRVPLFVWSLLEPGDRPPSSAAWGDVQDASTLPHLESAVALLRRSLDRQSIVWLEGRYLPQVVALSGSADGIELVR